MGNIYTEGRALKYLFKLPSITYYNYDEIYTALKCLLKLTPTTYFNCGNVCCSLAVEWAMLCANYPTHFTAVSY